MTIYLSPSAKQLRDRWWDGFWLGAFLWVAVGGLGGWMARIVWLMWKGAKCP